jgi:hypothetical protein
MAPSALFNGYRWSALMSQRFRFDPSRSLATLDQDSTIIAVIEMSQSKWLVAAVVPGVERQLVLTTLILATIAMIHTMMVAGRPFFAKQNARPARGRPVTCPCKSTCLLAASASCLAHDEDLSDQERHFSLPRFQAAYGLN